jgi:hypothetical protein
VLQFLHRDSEDDRVPPPRTRVVTVGAEDRVLGFVWQNGDVLTVGSKDFLERGPERDGEGGRARTLEVLPSSVIAAGVAKQGGEGEEAPGCLGGRLRGKQTERRSPIRSCSQSSNCKGYSRVSPRQRYMYCKGGWYKQSIQLRVVPSLSSIQYAQLMSRGSGALA